MMTDKELLGAAANSAGLELVLWQPDDTPHASLPNDTVSWRWNPLTDDGDALRLAVKLGLEVGHNSFGNVLVDHYTQPEVRKIVLPHGNNPYAATRAMLVRSLLRAGDGFGELNYNHSFGNHNSSPRSA